MNQPGPPNIPNLHDPLAAEPGPGQRLSQARADLDLSPEEVAQKLRLPPRHVLALENDDYQSLPGPTYVRGYLRAYARLLGLAPEPLLQAYARLPGSSATADLGKLAVEEQLTSQHHQVKLTTYLVVALVIVLALAWWQARQPGKPGNGVTAQSESTAPATAVGAPSGPLGPPEAPSSADARESAPQLGDNLAAGSSAIRFLSPGVIYRPEESVPAAAPSSAPNTQPLATAAGITQVVLYTDQGSWADIRDAGQHKLLYENLPAGRVVRLQGAPPLSVFLGNAGGVRMEINGQPYDLTPHRRGLAARFTWGGPARPSTPVPIP